MSVLIKGMEMPTSCEDCPMCHSNAEYDYAYCCVSSAETSGNKIPSDCPIVPVPPHGDLIDRDAYEKLLRGLGSRDYRREKGTICDAIKFLHPHYAPTIIPASGGVE